MPSEAARRSSPELAGAQATAAAQSQQLAAQLDEARAGRAAVQVAADEALRQLALSVLGSYVTTTPYGPKNVFFGTMA